MARKKEMDLHADVSKDSSSSPHHKKHKHKKHKKHKKKRSHGLGDTPEYGIATSFSSETVSSDSTGKPSLKLKIKFGGQTFGTKCVDRLTIPESSSEEEDEEEEQEEDDTFTFHDETPPVSHNQSVAGSERDEEEAWLNALEAGELNEHGEIKRHKNPAALTARQRALLHGITEEERQLTQLPNINRAASEILTTEMLEKRAQKAQKRRVQAKRKVEENKKQTIERLLKKQDSKAKGLKVRGKKQTNIPCISYVNSSINGISITYPPGRMFPMAKAIAQPPKPQIMCGVEGCTNPKLYCCSKTGIPLCSLDCYKKNASLTKVLCVS